MPVKFLNGYGNGNNFTAAAALNYAVAHGAKISNNSWESTSKDPGLQAALANAAAHGQIIVAAAGNEGSNLASSPVFPAGFQLNNVVDVAATDNTGALAPFSNYGASSVALAAPGVNVLSTTPGKSYGAASGTSFAAPHVSGVLALVWGLRPEWSYTQVINQVLDTATPLPALQGKVEAGEVNAAAAVRVPPRPDLPAVFQPAAVAWPATARGTASPTTVSAISALKLLVTVDPPPPGLGIQAPVSATVAGLLPGGTRRVVDVFFMSPMAVTGITLNDGWLRRRWAQLVSLSLPGPGFPDP
jgi:subtilisin family serine protease